MAGVKSGVSQAPCSAAARVFARFSACKVRFSGRMPALSATGTEPDGPNAAESHNRAGVRTVRRYAHGAAAAAGLSLSGARRDRVAACAACGRSAAGLRLSGSAPRLNAPAIDAARMYGWDGAAVSARPVAVNERENGANPAVSEASAGRAAFGASGSGPKNAGGGAFARRAYQFVLSGPARQKRKRA